MVSLQSRESRTQFTLETFVSFKKLFHFNFSMVLEIECRVLHILGTHSTTELHLKQLYCLYCLYTELHLCGRTWVYRTSKHI